MAFTEELLGTNPVAGTQPTTQNPSWIKDLIDKRYQPKTERLKRSPVGFNFTREPFDPSSYYRALTAMGNVSKTATTVVEQEAANRAAAQRAADQASAGSALGGINPNFTYNGSGTSRKYGLKGVAPDVARAADSIGSRFGIKTIGGRGPGSVPGSDHPKGLALDFMTYKNTGQGNAVSSYVLKNAKALNVKYVIWNRYIWYPGGNGHSAGWHKYNGPSPHTDHVHVSFNS